MPYTPLHPHRPGGSLTRAVGLLVIAALVWSVPTVASSQETDDPEASLDETRDRMDEVALQLDLLQQSDLELEARVAELDTEIEAQLAAVDVADAAAADAAQLVAEVDARVEVAQGRVDVQQRQLEERAVAGYISAGSSGIEAFLESSDYNEFHERTMYVGQVAEHDHDLLGELLAAQDELGVQQAAAADARAEAERLATEAQDALDRLEGARAEQEAVQQALDLRIDEFQSEVDELAAEEDALLALIAERATPIPPPTVTTTEPPVESTTTTTRPGTPSTSTPATTVPTSSPPTTTATTVPGGPGLQWPVSGVVTSFFGPRWGRMHNGIDIAADTGEPIHAAAGGTVILASWFGGYGNCVMVDHGNGWVTLYGHQSQLEVSEGDTVTAGQTVGLVGSTGHSTGPHLHFEVRVGGVPYDPMLYLP